MEVPIPDDWDGISFCRWSVCWPESVQWKAVLYGLIEMPNQGRFWDFHTGNFLELRNQFRDAYDYNFNLKEVIMACGDNGLQDIASAINNVASAMNAQAIASAYASAQCCDRQGSGGGGTTAPPFNPTEPGDPETDPPPDGFETWEEFLSDKCAIAWDIVETLESDLGQLALTNLTSIGTTALATILAVALATPIPFDDVIALAAFLLSIAAEVVIATALSLVNDNEGELACELFNGTNAQDSRSRFMSKYSDIVDNASVDPVEGFACKTIVGYMVQSSATNRMYIKDTTQSWPPRDCTGCEEGCRNIQIETGVLLSGDEDSGTYGGVQLAPNYYVTLYFNYEAEQPFDYTHFCGGYERVICVDPVNITPSVLPVYRIFDQDANQVYGSNEFPISVCGAGVLVITSTTAFEITVNRIDPCTPA
jgi:hypothetical protein